MTRVYTAGKVKDGMVGLTCDRATLLCRMIERESLKIWTQMKGGVKFRTFSTIWGNIQHFLKGIVY